jgi:hypothetical protein
MPATKPISPNEAHAATANAIYQLAKDAAHKGAPFFGPCAQLIADSEARALSSLAMVAAESADRNVSLRLENDQLRAEVERLKTCGMTELAAQNSSVADYCKHWEARAEQAEGKVAEQGLTLACLCDGILGEDAADRSDQTLLRAACTMKRDLNIKHENSALRGATARLCRAVSRRMQADEPTPGDRIELMEAYDAACALLANDKAQTRST